MNTFFTQLPLIFFWSMVVWFPVSVMIIRRLRRKLREYEQAWSYQQQVQQQAYYQPQQYRQW